MILAKLNLEKYYFVFNRSIIIKKKKKSIVLINLK